MHRAFAAWVAIWLLSAPLGAAWAHDPSLHKDGNGKEGAKVLVDPAANGPQAPLPASPFPAEIGGPFALTDQNGHQVTDVDFRGQYMMIFFGYSRCESICPVGLQTMAEAMDLIGDGAEKVHPILITVDPSFDTPEALAEAAPKIHPRLVGLTGSEEDLKAVRDAYKVEATVASQGLAGNPIYAHGSFIYLIGPEGELLSILPPILAPDQMANVVRKYLVAKSS